MEFVQERRKMDNQKKEPENEVGIQRSAQNKIIPPEAAVEKKKLRVPRSRTFINALKKADDIQAGEGEDIALVRSMPLNNKLLGILAGCRIPGCVIHAIDKDGNIIEHYRSVEEIPGDLKEGYQVFLQNAGCFSVEVYTLYYCVIFPDGKVKCLERS